MGPTPSWAARGRAAVALSASLFFQLLVLAGCATFAFFMFVTVSPIAALDAAAVLDVAKTVSEFLA